MQWDESSGFLWIATEAGLSRFNGIDFVNFTRANTSFISSERIRFMVRNKNNQIRAADMDGNVFSISENRPTLLYDHNKLSKNLAKDWEYRLVGAGIADSFFSLGPIPTPNRIAFPFAQLLPLTSFAAILINPQGTVVGMNLKDKKVEKWSGWGADNIVGFETQGTIYVQKKGTEYLYQWDRQTNRLIQSSLLTPNKNARIFWETGMEMPIAIDGKKAWVLSSKNNEAIFEEICNDIPNLGQIKYIQYSSKKGLLFLGTTSRGFAVVRANRIRQIKKAKADPADITAYYSQWEWKKGSILTNEGHVVGDHVKEKPPIKGRLGFSIYEEGDSLVWFSTGQKNKAGSVLHTINRKTGKHQVYDKIDIFNVFALNRWKNQPLIGNHNGLGLIKGDSLSLLFPASTSKIEHATAFNILEAEPGVFYMATCSGWIRFNLNRKIVDTLLKLPGYCIRSQTKIGDYIFIGTYGKGIYIYRNGKLKNIPLDKNLFLLYAHCFVTDKNGYVWISTNRGLFKAQAKEMIQAFENENSSVYYHYLGRNDGMQMTELNGGCSPCAMKLQDGTLSFPSMDGLVWVHPEISEPLMPDGPLFVDRIQVDNITLSEAAFKEQALPYNFKAITIDLGYSAWANAENIYLEYRLSNTARWSSLTVSEGPKIRYSNLPSGKYQLQIRKRNGFGKDNFEYRKIPFTIETAWYNNSLFYFFVMSVLVFCIYLISNYQNRRLIARQKELESLVQEKTRDLQEQYNVLEKSNRINNRLISIISHDIVTPLKFLTSTGKGLYRKKSELPEETQQEILEEMVNTSQELHLLSTNILNWIKYQSGNKRLLTEKIIAQDIVQQVLSILAPLAKEKNLQLINSIDGAISFNQFVEPFKILIYNLVLNSIRYSDTGEITVNIKKEAENYIVAVSDKGMGMSAAKIESLLNDSSPIREKSTDNKSGHGLGYLIIRDIVQWMDAQIEITSTLGKETTARVTFQSLKNQSVYNS